jgi:hypothetical protein
MAMVLTSEWQMRRPSRTRNRIAYGKVANVKVPVFMGVGAVSVNVL